MELVIKIPYGTYDAIQQGLTNQVITNKLWESVKIGVPLPEHHGRLIDADWVKNTLDIYVINEYKGQFIRRNDIDSVPTIIEGSDSE